MSCLWSGSELRQDVITRQQLLVNDISRARLWLCVLIYKQMLLCVVLCCLQGAVNFKFGVLYAKAGQKTDNEMFSNGEQLLIENSIYEYHASNGAAEVEMPGQLCSLIMLQ